jgi:hypothetical protein
MTTLSSAARPSGLIDARTVGPSLLVLALWVVMALVVPAIDSATSYRDQVDKGDVAQVADGITLVPAVGWTLASGALRGRTRSPVGDTATTEVANGGVDLQAQAAPFAGTASALLSRVNAIAADLAPGKAVGRTRRYRVRTDQGAVGVAQDFVGANRQGTVVAFVFPATGPAGRSSSSGATAREGVTVAVSGPTGSVARRRDDIVAMIRSLRTGS